MPMNNKQYFTTPSLLGKHCFCTKYHHLTATTANLHKWLFDVLKNKTFSSYPKTPLFPANLRNHPVTYKYKGKCLGIIRNAQANFYKYFFFSKLFSLYDSSLLYLGKGWCGSTALSLF